MPHESMGTLMDNWGKWILELLSLLAIPSVVTWALYDRRRVRAADKISEADAQVADATIPHHIQSSSVVTMEAQVAALGKSFDMDRTIKDATIAYLRRELAEKDAEIDRKDAVIDDLLSKVRSMGAQMDQMRSEQRKLEKELVELKQAPPHPHSSPFPPPPADDGHTTGP
jgi:cob(I)alamin adenosyltransferase